MLLWLECSGAPAGDRDLLDTGVSGNRWLWPRRFHGDDDPHPSARVADKESTGAVQQRTEFEKVKALAKPLSDATNTGASPLVRPLSVL